MNKEELEELRRIELEQAAERLRTAIRRMRDDGPSSRDVRIEPKGSTLYVVYGRDRGRQR